MAWVAGGGELEELLAHEGQRELHEEGAREGEPQPLRVEEGRLVRRPPSRQRVHRPAAEEPELAGLPLGDGELILLPLEGLAAQQQHTQTTKWERGKARPRKLKRGTGGNKPGKGIGKKEWKMKSGVRG